MKMFAKYRSVWIIVVLIASVLCSCSEVTSYLVPPKWIEIEMVSDKSVDLRWESVEGAKQYIVYKDFAQWQVNFDSYIVEKIESNAYKCEVARTTVPEYQYQGSYDPKENGYTDGYSYKYYCYFGVRVVDENGNMSRVKVVEVPKK